MTFVFPCSLSPGGFKLIYKQRYAIFKRFWEVYLLVPVKSVINSTKLRVFIRYPCLATDIMFECEFIKRLFRAQIPQRWRVRASLSPGHAPLFSGRWVCGWGRGAQVCQPGARLAAKATTHRARPCVRVRACFCETNGARCGSYSE